MSMLSALGNQTWNSDLGEFITDDHQRFAEVLHDLNPNLSLVYIPQKDRDASDTKPWAIRQDSPNQPSQLIRYLSDAEMRNPEKILSWVYEGDLIRHGKNAVWAKMEAEDKAKQLLDLKRQEDEAEDNIAQMEFFMSGGRDRLHTFKHNGKTFRR